MNILGFDISHKSSFFQLTIGIIGIFVCYSLYGILQEEIFRQEGFDYGLYLTFVQFIIYSLISAVQRNTETKYAVRKAPYSSYFLISFLSVSTVALSNISCQYLNYPTQVLFKSCKLIPVMLVGVCYLNKKYKSRDYLSVVLLSSGIITFSLGNTKSDQSFDFPFLGVFLISLALAADAIIGNVQEKVLVQYDASTTEMIYYTKIIGLIYLFSALIVKQELFSAFAFCARNPNSYLYIIAFSVIGCIGEQFVMAVIKRFGALIAVITTSLRKMLTIVLSFIIYPKPFSLAYALGLILVFAGIGLESYIKNEKAIQNYINEWKWRRKNGNKLDLLV